MKHFHLTPMVLWLVTALGCGSTPVLDTRDSRNSHPPKIATGGDTPPAPSVATPYEGPPHVFTPTSHPPRYRYGNAGAPHLAGMPKLKMRFDQCFRRAPARRPVPIASPQPKPSTWRSKASSSSSRSSGRRAPRKGAGSAADLFGAPTGGSAAAAGSTGAVSTPPSSGEKKERAPSSPPPSYSAPMEAAADEAPMAMDMEMEEEEMVARPREGKQRIAGDDDGAVIQEEAPPEEDPYDKYDDWGAAIYLSNDDTMSLSSAQRVIYAIDNFLPLPADHIRPHELLNYFSFDTAEVTDGYDFSVLGEVAPDTREAGIYSLALAVKGRPVDKTSRRNAAITFVIDRSGSMSDEGRMSYLKRGLLRMVDELKTGDMLNLVLFDHELCVPMENFVVGRDDTQKLKKVIDALEPKGATDLHMGLSKGYEIADRVYQEKYSNRVVLITDALTNTGVTNDQMISMISKYYDTRKIRLSGVGVGRQFNDALLDRLTERGKGAYVFLGSEMEVDAVFGSRFISLIETTALDVHFRLHLPPSLRMNVFYGEESSTVKEDVQEIHYFANTSQLFLSDLMARGGTLRPEDGVMLSIEYKDPESGEALREEYAFTLGDLQRRARNVAKARVIMAWIDMLAEMAARQTPETFRHRGSAGSWQDPEGWQRCEDGRSELERLAGAGGNDGEITRVMELWTKYCARFERPRHPVKRKIAVPEDSWPGASGSKRR